MMNNRFFPIDTYELYKELLNNNSTIYDFSDNFYYIFNMPKIEEDERRLPKDIIINENTEKYQWDYNFIRNLQSRRRNLIEKLKAFGYHSVVFQATCAWRLVVGLGASHPQETSMTLHHLYGIPYIPGSAIKGVTRQWAILKFAQKITDNNKSLLEAIAEVATAFERGKILDIEFNELHFETLIKIFGTQKQAGQVIFMDAYPIENIKLKIDIINVHYPDYYSGEKPPADWQSPRLIKFLTVEKTIFEFALLSKQKEYIEKTAQLLREALESQGIGAKTSLGYGIFHNISVGQDTAI